MKKNQIILLVLLYVVFSIQACTEQRPISNQSKESTSNQIKNRIISSANGVSILRDAQGNRISNANDGGGIRPLFGHNALSPSHVRGARIYDDFIIELGAAPPPDNPLAALADNPVPGNPWLCSSCHGFDYEGTTPFAGADVNLQDLIPVRGRDEEFVIHMLNDGFRVNNNGVVETMHSYAGILTPQAMVDVADFVVNEIYDTHQVLSAATGIGLGDMAEGNELFNDPLAPLPTGVPAFIRADGSAFNCVQCHDGVTASDGATLKGLALADPFKFLHRTNFGLPRAGQSFGYGDMTIMPGLYEIVLTDGLHFGGPEDAGAVMHFIQMSF